MTAATLVLKTRKMSSRRSSRPARSGERSVGSRPKVLVALRTAYLRGLSTGEFRGRTRCCSARAAGPSPTTSAQVWTGTAGWSTVAIDDHASDQRREHAGDDRWRRPEWRTGPPDKTDTRAGTLATARATSRAQGARSAAASRVVRQRDGYGGGPPPAAREPGPDGKRSEQPNGANAAGRQLRGLASPAATERALRRDTRRRPTTDREKCLLKTWVTETEWLELIQAWAERVYTLRELVFALHRAGITRSRHSRTLNRWANRVPEAR